MPQRYAVHYVLQSLQYVGSINSDLNLGASSCTTTKHIRSASVCYRMWFRWLARLLRTWRASAISHRLVYALAEGLPHCFPKHIRLALLSASRCHLPRSGCVFVVRQSTTCRKSIQVCTRSYQEATSQYMPASFAFCCLCIDLQMSNFECVPPCSTGRNPMLRNNCSLRLECAKTVS